MFFTFEKFLFDLVLLVLLLVAKKHYCICIPTWPWLFLLSEISSAGARKELPSSLAGLLDLPRSLA